MKIGLISIASDLSRESQLEKVEKVYLQELKSSFAIEKATDDRLNDYELILVLILSGGSEQKFTRIFESLNCSQKPFFILSTDSDNSLPASLEILSWLREEKNYLKSKIFHGTPEAIKTRLEKHLKIKQAEISFKKSRFGIIGKPSDWLIASTIDYESFANKIGGNFIQITMEEVYKRIKEVKVTEKDIQNFIEKFGNPENDYTGSIRIYLALKAIIKDYKLDAFTLKCFDILDKTDETGCLALSILNDEGIVAGCEGDVPTMLSMQLAKELTSNPSFMANPSKIDETGVTFAHCTIPGKLMNKFYVDSHFESGKGFAVAGILPEGKVTVFKAGGKQFNKFWIEEGLATSIEHSDCLCRVQTKICMSNHQDYFFNKTIGNHHVIIPGNFTQELIELCSELGLERVG
jgi:L-fucose isomerase-like protein